MLRNPEFQVFGIDGKSKAIKQLHKKKVESLTLRKSPFCNRPLVFYLHYPETTLAWYSKLQKLTGKQAAEPLDSDNRVGVSLGQPESGALVKFRPYTYLKKFSVPYATVGRSYAMMIRLMKESGFITSHSRHYNVSWGINKKKEDFSVVAAHPGPGRLPAFLPLFRLLAGGQERLSVDQPQQKTKNLPRALRFRAADFPAAQQFRLFPQAQSEARLLDPQAGRCGPRRRHPRDLEERGSQGKSEYPLLTRLSGERVHSEPSPDQRIQV